jgi:cohesin loading factor subunit SCC2
MEQDKLFKDILNEKLFRALDCSIISLIIMTSPRMSSELIVEDIIEQIVTFTKLNLNQVIFPHYDAVYKTVTVSSSFSSDNNKNLKRKLLNQFSANQSGSTAASTASSVAKANKNIQYFFNKTREILNLIGDLVSQTDMTDTIVIILSTLTVMCFFVENINELQLECLKIATCIFTRYPKHRQLVFDDIFASLIKLHPTKRNSRAFKCFDGDSIQMFSALILQLLQSEVSTLDCFNPGGESRHSEVSFEEKETHLINTFESSCQTAKKFLSLFFAKCKTKQADFDFRPLFENFIQDMLVTVNKPEWPVAETVLNLLGIILVSQIQNEQSDVSSRVNSLEYLGQIVSQLRRDSLEYQKQPEKIINLLDKLEIKVGNLVSLPMLSLRNLSLG